MEFFLDGKPVGRKGSVFLIAEVGTTANGDLATALKLIDRVKEAGFDAIKFQNISPPDYMSDRSVTYRFATAGGTRELNMYDMLMPLVFDRGAWAKIMQHAKGRSLPCFATVNWLGGVDIMEDLGAPAHKIASWDLNYPDLQRRIFCTGKPVFVDLGPVRIAEVLKIRELARECANEKIVFLYDFHTAVPDQMNMLAIPYLQDVLGEPVGFSSPGKEWELDVMSLGLGATVLEKRVTLDDRDPGHHHFAAVAGDEVPRWVNTMRQMTSALGRRALIPSDGDLADAKKYFRGVTALRSIRKGEVFSKDNLGAKRPWNGLDPGFLDVVWGSRAAVDIAADSQISWGQIDRIGQ